MSFANKNQIVYLTENYFIYISINKYMFKCGESYNVIIYWTNMEEENE